MRSFLVKLYFSTLAIFFAIDFVWLAAVANKFYSAKLGYLMAANTNWLAALLFYLLFIVGILVFVVLPGLEKHSLRFVLVRAALFGLISYATYDLTNLATIQDWPLVITVVDLLWGTTVTMLVSYLSFKVGQRLQKA
jgi:uncharacterized membrane protein